MSPVKPDRSCSRETRPPTSLGSWSLDEAQKKGKIAFVVVRVRGATCHSNKQPNKTLTLVRWFEIAADADAECGAVAWTIFPSFFFWLGGGKKHGAVHTAWTRSFTPSSIAHAVSAVDNPQLAVAGGCKLVASLPTEAYPIQPTSKYFACLPTCLSACLPSPSPSVGGSRARNDMGVRNDINRNILIYNTACYITFPPSRRQPHVYAVSTFRGHSPPVHQPQTAMPERTSEARSTMHARLSPCRGCPRDCIPLPKIPYRWHIRPD